MIWDFFPIPGRPHIHRFEVKNALSRKYLDKALKVINQKINSDGERSSQVTKRKLPDTRPKPFRLILPANVIEDFDCALGRARLRQFARDEGDVSPTDFFKQLLELERRDWETSLRPREASFEYDPSGVAEPES